MGGKKSNVHIRLLRPTQVCHVICVSQDEDGQGLSDEEIQAESNTFMFAGEMEL